MADPMALQAQYEEAVAEEATELAEQVERRNRLDVVWRSRAARSCAERVARLEETFSGTPFYPPTVADELAGADAATVIHILYVDRRPIDHEDATRYAWQARALHAWARLYWLATSDHPVHEFAVHDMAELEAADAAIPWRVAEDWAS